MKKVLSVSLLFFLSIIAISVNSQTLVRDVVANAGETQTAGQLTVEWTLGELMIESYEENIMVTQGFHQPGVSFIGIDGYLDDNGTFKVYPNPTDGLLFFELGNPDLKVKHITILDMAGREVYNALSSAQTLQSSINVSNYESGVYLVRFTFDNGSYVLKKIIKN